MSSSMGAQLTHTTNRHAARHQTCSPALPVRLPVRSVGSNMGAQLTYTAKLESVAASAVKSADKVGAALMVVVTHTGELRLA